MVRCFGNIDEWYNSDLLVNILSLAEIMDQFIVKIDSKKEHAFLVWIRNSSAVRYQQRKLGLFYYVTTENNKAFLFHDTYKNDAYDFNFLQMVTNNKAHLGLQEVKGAEEAIRVSKLLLHPSLPTFKSIIARKFICNLLITIADVKCTNKVFHPSVHEPPRKLQPKLPT